MIIARDKPEIKALLFDLGGVLFELNDPQETFAFETSEDEFLERWIQSPSVRSFESGKIDANTFARGIVDEAALPYGATEFLQRFASWPKQLFPGIEELLDSIPSQFTRALLSNTNDIHWQRDDVLGTLSHRFEHIFLSHITGCLKPDEDAFQLVRQRIGLAAREIAFFDDNPANIAAADNFGFHSVLTKGGDELRTALEHLGVLHQP